MEDNIYSALLDAMEHSMLDAFIDIHNSDPNDSHVDSYALTCIGYDVEGRANIIFCR